MNPDRTDESKVQGLIERAELLIDVGRSADALPLLQQALSLAPDDSTPFGWMALALHASGRGAEGLKFAEQAAAKSPDWEWPHRLRGIILLDQHKLKEALAAAKTAVQLAPSDRDPLHLLASCLMTAKRYQDAWATAVLLSQVAPDWDLTHNLFASIAARRRQWTECERHSLQALELNPESITALHNLGDALRQLGRKTEASDCYRRALVLNPTDTEARRALLTLVSFELAELPIWKRKARLEQEHPSVQSFVVDAQERAQREAVPIMVGIWLGMGWVFTTGWTALLLLFSRRGGLLHYWWEWMCYLAIAGATIGGTVVVARSKFGRTRQ